MANYHGPLEDVDCHIYSVRYDARVYIAMLLLISSRGWGIISSKKQWILRLVHIEEVPWDEKLFSSVLASTVYHQSFLRPYFEKDSKHTFNDIAILHSISKIFSTSRK